MRQNCTSLDAFVGPASGRRLIALAATLALSLSASAPALAQRGPDLTMLSLEQLLQVTVVGAAKYEQKQSEVAAAVSVITRQEIQAFGWRTLDQALSSLPGVHTTYDRQYNYLGTRGFGLPGDYNSRVLVTVNGNRVNDPIYDGGPMGSQMPLDMALVERIEFIPGPGGAVYGQNAMLGVVNVVTRSGALLDGAELEAGWQHPLQAGDLRASWGRKLDNGVDWLLSASAMRAKGEDRFYDYGAAGISGTAAGLDGERLSTAFARASGAAWSVDLTYSNRRKDDPTAIYGADPLVPGQFQADDYLIANAQFGGTADGERLQWQTRLFAGRYRFDSVLSFDTPYQLPAKGDWRGAEARLVYTGLPGHKLMLGLEAQDNPRIEQITEDLAAPANNFTISSPGWRVGVYAQDEWRLADALLATLGLRFDRNSSTGNKTSPRAALIWTPNAATTLKALAGRAHRAPNAYERDYDDGLSQVGNAQLAGETIDTYELVADHRVGADLLLRASVYRWTMRNLIVLGLDPVSGLPQYQSGESVDAQGLELSADRTWSSGMRLRGSATIQDIGYAGGEALPNAPRVLGKMNLSTPLPWGGLRAGVEWQVDSRRLAIDGSALGGYGIVNLHLGTQRLAKGLEATLTLRNLFDKQYAHPGSDTNWQNALEQDGRGIRVGLVLSF